MTKNSLLNLSVSQESLGGEPATSPTVTSVPTIVISAPVPDLPSPQSQTDDVARLKAIADALDETYECLGNRIARIGMAVIGGNTVVSTEAINLGDLAATVKRYVLMAIEFIKRFLVALGNFGKRFIESLRYNRKEMSDLLRDIQNFMKVRRGQSFTIEGTSVTLLQIRGEIPAGVGDLARSFNEFRRDIDIPYNGWLKDATDKVKEIAAAVAEIFTAQSLIAADAALFDRIAQVMCPQPPANWKKDVSVGSGLWSYVPKVPAWGGVRVNVVGDESIAATDVTASMVTPFDSPDQPSTVTLTGDLLTEYAKLGVGLVDMQVSLAAPYDAVRDLSKQMMDKYTTRFVGVDNRGLSPTDQQIIATRNSQLNDAMGYLSFVMTSTANYMAYLTALRDAVQQTLGAVMAEAEESTK